MKDEMGGTCRMHGEEKGVYRALVGRPKRKPSLGGPRHR
jgi:hypothetical protein